MGAIEHISVAWTRLFPSNAVVACWLGSVALKSINQAAPETGGLGELTLTRRVRHVLQPLLGPWYTILQASKDGVVGMCGRVGALDQIVWIRLHVGWYQQGYSLAALAAIQSPRGATMNPSIHQLYGR